MKPSSAIKLQEMMGRKPGYRMLTEEELELLLASKREASERIRELHRYRNPPKK